MFKGLPIAIFFSCVQLFSSTKTDQGDWFIYSPKLVLVSERKRDIDPSNTVENLEKLCQMVAKKMALAQTNEEKGQLSQENFSSIDASYLISVIDQILENDTLLETVTKSSYKNATGFAKIVLAQGGREDGWKARLHIWKNDRTKEFPHNHKWDFYSKIFSGYLKQDLYSFDKGGDFFHIREPSSLLPPLPSGQKRCPCRDEYELSAPTQQKAITLSVKDSSKIAVGEAYFFSNELIHTIEPSLEDAISFVFTSRRIKENSEVYVQDSRMGEDLTKVAPGFTKEELKKELIKAKSVLGQLSIKERYLPEIISETHQYFPSFDPIYSNLLWREEVKQLDRGTRVIQKNELELSLFKFSSDSMGKVLIGEQPIDPSSEYIFVLTDEGMYGAMKDFHHKGESILCHSSFTNYGPCHTAGVLHFNIKGDLEAIEAYSGHYQPAVADMKRAYDYFSHIGVEVKYANIIPYKDRT